MVRFTLSAIMVLGSLAVAQTPATQPALQIKEMAPGKPGAQPGDTLLVYYTGKLQNGTVFDSNVGGRLFRFVLGGGEVIRGWDQGMVDMQVGEKRELIVPPNLGYGATAHAAIPANSTLDFTVQLVGIVRMPK